MTQLGDMTYHTNVSKSLRRVLLGSTYTKIGKVLTTAAAVLVPRPTERESVAQGLFFGGSGRRAVAHTRPAFPKNAYGPVGIPLIRGASGAGRWTQPPRRE